MHVPKTGGTTLRYLLELQLSTEEIYPYRNCKLAEIPFSGNLVSGHFPYWFCKNLDKDFDHAFKVTILRDPIERYASFLRAKKRKDPSLPDLESAFQLRWGAQKKYEQGLIDNSLCRYFSANPHLKGKALLESAKKTLRDIDCVILFSDFTQNISDLFGRLGIELSKGDIPKTNVTEKEPISRSLLKKIKKVNALDIQLYEYAKNHLIPKNTQYPLRTLAFENILKKTSEVDYTFDLPLNGKGWTEREIIKNRMIESPTYRWVTDSPADIYFSLEDNLDYSLFFHAYCLIEEVKPKVYVNGVEIEVRKLNNEEFSLYHGIIPKDVLSENTTVITFSSLQACEYRDSYPGDHTRNYPLLSFAVNRIQIRKKGS